MERNLPSRELQALLRAVRNGDVVAAKAHNSQRELLLRLPDGRRSGPGARTRQTAHAQTAR
jgi:hypothetical protein